MFTRQGRGRCLAAVKMGHTPSFVSRKIGNREFVVDMLILGKILRIDVNEVGFAKVCDPKLTENIIDNRGGKFDGAVIRDGARGFKSREDKGIDIFFERNAVLQPKADCDGKTIHEASEGGTLFVHVNKNFAE